jgi:hypothetical protein
MLVALNTCERLNAPPLRELRSIRYDDVVEALHVARGCPFPVIDPAIKSYDSAPSLTKGLGIVIFLRNDTSITRTLIFSTIAVLLPALVTSDSAVFIARGLETTADERQSTTPFLLPTLTVVAL